MDRSGSDGSVVVVDDVVSCLRRLQRLRSSACERQRSTAAERARIFTRPLEFRQLVLPYEYSVLSSPPPAGGLRAGVSFDSCGLWVLRA